METNNTIPANHRVLRLVTLGLSKGLASFASTTLEMTTGIKEMIPGYRGNPIRRRRNEQRLSWKCYPSLVDITSVVEELTNAFVSTLFAFRGNPICLRSATACPSWKCELSLWK